MKRFILDILLLVLILLVMGFHFLPKLVHEVGGLMLLAGVIWHLVWNRRWFASFMRGRWGNLRILQSILGLLLIIAFFATIVTGIIISNHVFREFWVGVPLHRSVFVHQLHVSSSYFMVILGGMHIGMHWTGLWQRLKKLTVLGLMEQHPALRFWSLVLIGWAGCAMSRLDQIGDRLLLKHILGTIAAKLPAGIYFLLMLCLMGLYAIAFYYLQRYFIRKNQKLGGADK